MVSLVSWKYPVDFMVIQQKLMEGHPMILGRPWLATTYAYTSCRKGEMPFQMVYLQRKLLCIHLLNLHKVIFYG